MRLTALLFVILFSFPSTGYAINIDSLKQQLLLDIPDSTRFSIYEEIFWDVLYADPNKALQFADTCMQIANRLDDDKLRVATFLNYTNGNILLRELDTALVKVEKGLAISQKNNFKNLTSRLTGSKASIFTMMGKNEQAAAILEGILANQISLKDSQQIVITLSNLGTIKEKMKLEEQAINHYLSALDYATAAAMEKRRGVIQMNIGGLYGVLKDQETAVTHFEKAEEIFTQQKDTFYLLTIYNNLGQVYLDAKIYDKAENYFKTSLKINTFHVAGMGFSNYGLGSIYIKKKKYALALDHANKALAFDKEIKNLENIPGDYMLIGRILSAQNKHSEALKQFALAEKINDERPLHLEKIILKRNILTTTLQKNKLTEISDQFSTYFTLRDSFDLLAKQETIKDIETKYQTEKKEAKNQLLQNEKELQAVTILNQQKTLFAGGIGATLLGIIALLLFRQNKDKKANIQTLSEQNHKIQTLHTELNHRVKNNLGLVSSLMKLQSRRLEHPEAKQAVAESEARVAAMSILHRKLSLDGSDREIDLGEYLGELCQNISYAFPQLENQPEIKFDMEPIMFDAEKSVWVGLIVNELVTNSFKYAFADQTNPKIYISMERSKDDRLNMTYQDNGIGLPDGISLENITSMGLKLIHTLTQQLDGSITIKNKEGANFQFSFNDRQQIS